MTLVDELRLAALELRRAAKRWNCLVMKAELNAEAVALDEAADRAASIPGQFALGRARQRLPPRRVRHLP